MTGLILSPELPTVLVVDDDESIAELLRDFLENDGFRVRTADSAERALAELSERPVDCLVLDIMMPGMNGFELCRRIRETSSVPLLFLSARGEDVDKIRGLAIGGDDYIVKSASPGEIVARVKAVLRRAGASREPRAAVLDDGRLRLDLATREVWVNGRGVSLSPKEYDLLRWFAEHPRQVFTYEQLLDRFWEGVGDKHTIRVHLGRLREKLEEKPNEPRYLINVWGVGYRFGGRFAD